MRILIAEDDVPSRRLLKVHLSAAGHEVIESEDGLQAWELFQNEHFRMVITDWMMPELSGPALIQRIRSQPPAGYTYMIIVTALNDKAMVVEGLAAGADDYLTKPYYSDELLARVKIGERILQLEDRLREAREEMKFLAMHDGLTGLFNRRAIQDNAEAEFQRAAREATATSVLLIDLDHFKAVNDQHGHLAGDQALRLFAKILLANIRPYDWAGRWGGEEFLCVLPGTTLAEAGQVAERIRSAVAASDLPVGEGVGLKLTASIGAAGSGSAPAALGLDPLMRAADEALYRAKREGRNRVCLAE